MKLKLILSLFLLLLTIHESNCQSIRIKKRLEKNKVVYNTFFINHGKTLVLNSENTLKLYELDSFKCINTINLKSKIITVEAHSDSNLLFFAGDNSGNINYYQNDSLIDRINTSTKKIKLLKLNQTKELIAYSDGKSVNIINFPEKSLAAKIDNLEGEITDIEFALSDEILIISTTLGKVIFWNYIENIIQASINSHKDYIRNIAICPDSSRIATCGDDKKIIIYDLSSKNYYVLEKSHSKWIIDIEFIDNNYLLSIGHDHKLVLNNSNKIDGSNYKYKFDFLPALGDFYLNDICISNELKTVSISSLGKGIVLTNHFHDFINFSHAIMINVGSSSKFIESAKEVEFISKNDTCSIKGTVERFKSVEKIWLRDKNVNDKYELKMGSEGKFNVKVPLENEKNIFSIILEDKDKDLIIIEYGIIILKE